MLKLNLSFDDISLYPKSVSFHNSRMDPGMCVNHIFSKKDRTLEGIPIVAANMDTIGTVEMCRALAKYRFFTALHKHNKNEDVLELLSDPELSPYIFYTIGMNPYSIAQVKWLIEKGIDFNKLQVCFEVANGYMSEFLNKIEEFYERFPWCVIMAGNVISKEMIKFYLDVGVDIIKVGIGNGSACTTSRIAGIGVPQYSLVEYFHQQRDYYDFLLCSDGGCKEPGHIVKALAGGADFVMVGNMLAGSDEANTRKFHDVVSGNSHCEYYGMSSKIAMEKHGSQVNRVPEGKLINVPYTGPVANTLEEIVGGLRSACTYLNVDVEHLFTVDKVVIK